MSELAGLFIHLDNYQTKRDLAQVGWSLFKGLVPNKCQCQLRLLFLGRFTFPPEDMIYRNQQKMCPDPINYKHGAQAYLKEALSLTLM
jgi:hypothetical protein